MRNILVVDYNDSGEDVMIINTTLTVEQVEASLLQADQHFEEIYEVPEAERSAYVYDPLYADEAWDKGVLTKLNNQD